MRRAYTVDFGEWIEQPGGSFTRIETLPSGESTRLQSRYRLDKSSIVLNVGERLPAMIADLLDIGVAVALTDRVSPRFGTGDEFAVNGSGVRSLRVRIPVRKPEHWSQSDVRDALSNTLLEFSGDDWIFEFVRRDENVHAFSEQLPLEIPTALAGAESVLVYSGGLDSLLGLLYLVELCEYQSIVLASVATHDRMAAVQSVTSTAIRDFHRVNLRSSRLKVGLTREFPLSQRESSQRARGFLFLVNGIAISLLAELTTLTVFENGIGAINLPYTVNQLGYRRNRAMHPRTLQAVARFVEESFGQPFQIVNPALWETKQQLVQRFGASPAFGSAAPLTVSCDRFPYKPQNQPCGICTSCILRRLSLHGAGLDVIDAGMEYKVDLFASSFRGKGWRSLVPLIAMNGQAEGLQRHLSNFGDLESILDRYPDFADILCAQGGATNDSMIKTMQRVSDLYARYVSEWQPFVAQIRWPAERVTCSPLVLKLGAHRSIAS